MGMSASEKNVGTSEHCKPEVPKEILISGEVSINRCEHLFLTAHTLAQLQRKRECLSPCKSSKPQKPQWPFLPGCQQAFSTPKM
eukprot:220216-Pelagomonas_calceolata.AAC.1